MAMMGTPAPSWSFFGWHHIFIMARLDLTETRRNVMTPNFGEKKAVSGMVQRLILIGGIAWLAAISAASAQKIENEIAVFAALDKVTARVSPLEIPINQTATFGALKITPRVCYTRPPTEPPKTTSFVQIDEVQLNGTERRIFSGWMFAQSPGLYAVEHPTFDVWLTNCKTSRPETVRGRQPKLPRP